MRVIGAKVWGCNAEENVRGGLKERKKDEAFSGFP
jgi:hypothetical protein